MRYLRAKRREAFLSLITVIAIVGVGLGVMTLVVVLSVMSGFEEDLRDRILGFTPHVLITPESANAMRDEGLLGRVRVVAGVETAAPFVTGQVMLASGNDVAGAILRGVMVDGSAAIDLQGSVGAGVVGDMAERHAVLGDGAAVVRLPGVVIGRQLARRLRVAPGDPIAAVSPQPMLTAIGLVPRVKRFAVVGVFDSGMSDYDAALAFVHLPEAQRFFRLDDLFTGVEVRVDDLERADLIGHQIAAAAGFSFRVRDWMQDNQALFSALQLEKTVYFVVLLLIVLVAAFNIVATLVMVVMEKRKDIAILKSMGATRTGIAAIFVSKGMIIGLLGTLGGTLVGYVACLLLQRYGVPLPPDVFYVSTIPVTIHPGHFAAVVLVSLAICLLASIYPARQAARLAPVDIIRYE
jgi:lipoprotein-releasing system permease protein